MKEKINSNVEKPLAEDSGRVVPTISTIPSNGVNIANFKDRKIE